MLRSVVTRYPGPGWVGFLRCTVADESKIAGVKARIRSVHINETLPHNFCMVRVTSIGDEGKEPLQLRMLVKGREVIVAK
jgi:hypothetical protein